MVCVSPPISPSYLLRTATWLWLVGWLTASSVVGQRPATEFRPTVDQTALERVALGKARSNLYQALVRLPITDGLTIGGWLARQPAQDRAFRAWSRRQPWIGGPRAYSDASCDVDVCVKPRDLAWQLTEMLRTHEGTPPEGAPSLADIQKAAEMWPVIWATGIAETPEARRTGQAEGWEDVSAEGVQLARLAAQADAAFALLDEAARLKVTPARRVSDFLSASPEVRMAVVAAFQESLDFKIELSPDQVCVARTTLTIPDLIRILIAAHQKAYQGDVFQAADFREMTLTNPQGEVAAAGLAPPPDKYRIRPEYETIELDRPDWLDRTLTATGRYERQDGDDFPMAMQTELARWDGMDALRRLVEALPLPGGVTVERLLGLRPGLKDDVVMFLSGARIVSPPPGVPDAEITVHVELPLERLWKIMRRGYNLIEIEPSAASRPALSNSEIEADK